MILLAGVPFLAILVAWNGLDFAGLATLFLLLARGRLGRRRLGRRGLDRLTPSGAMPCSSVYILMLMLVLSPLLRVSGCRFGSPIGWDRSIRIQHEPPGLGR